VSFKEQLYSELQSQLTQTRLDLQRRQPVVTVVEEPFTPKEPSGMSAVIIVASMFSLGLVLAIVASLLKEIIGKEVDKLSEEEYDMLRREAMLGYITSTYREK